MPIPLFVAGVLVIASIVGYGVVKGTDGGDRLSSAMAAAKRQAQGGGGGNAFGNANNGRDTVGTFLGTPSSPSGYSAPPELTPIPPPFSFAAAPSAAPSQSSFASVNPTQPTVMVPAAAPAAPETFLNPFTGTEAVPTSTGGVGDVGGGQSFPGADAAGNMGTWTVAADGTPTFTPGAP